MNRFGRWRLNGVVVLVAIVGCLAACSDAAPRSANPIVSGLVPHGPTQGLVDTCAVIDTPLVEVALPGVKVDSGPTAEAEGIVVDGKSSGGAICKFPVGDNGEFISLVAERMDSLQDVNAKLKGNRDPGSTTCVEIDSVPELGEDTVIATFALGCSVMGWIVRLYWHEGRNYFHLETNSSYPAANLIKLGQAVSQRLG